MLEYLKIILISFIFLIACSSYNHEQNENDFNLELSAFQIGEFADVEYQLRQVDLSSEFGNKAKIYLQKWIL